METLDFTKENLVFSYIIGKSYKHFSNMTYESKKEKQILQKKIYDFLISCIIGKPYKHFSNMT